MFWRVGIEPLVAPRHRWAGSRDGYERALQVKNLETEPVVKRSKMVVMGGLVVRLKPYPDLVNMTGLGWLNQLYLSYRDWQRWLLAKRVYHDLEMDTGKKQTALKAVMWPSWRVVSVSGSARACGMTVMVETVGSILLSRRPLVRMRKKENNGQDRSVR